MNPKTLLDQILPSAAQSADRLLTEVWPISAMWPIRTPVAILFGAVTARCFEGECCLTAAGKSSIVAVLDGVSFQGSSAQGTSPPPRRKIWCLGSLFRFSFRIASEPRPCCKNCSFGLTWTCARAGTLREQMQRCITSSSRPAQAQRREAR